MLSAVRDEQHQRAAVGIAARDDHAESALDLGPAHQARRLEPRGQAVVHQRGAIAVEARQRDVRAKEGAGAARAFLARRNR